MKKILSFFISIMILLAAAAPASAAGLTVTVTSSSASVKAGDNVTFTVSLSGSGSARSGSIAVSYDDSFELVSGEFLKSGATLSSFDPDTNKGALAFTSPTDMNGAYFKLVLKAKKAGAAEQAVSFAVELKNGTSTVGSGSASKSVKIVCASHSYGAWQNVNNSQHKRTCSVCGYVETANHTWNSGTVTKQPTCKDTGVKTYTCTACNATKTETIAKTNNHSYGSWTTTKAATCTATGTQERACSICGKKETKSIAATGHSYGAWKATKEATCTAGGTEACTCSKCGAQETRSTKALGHSFSSPTVTKQPTCTEPGIESGKCSRCGQTTTQEIPALGHKFSAWKQTKAASCTEKGAEERTCSVCGIKETRETEVLGHDFENPTIVKEATLTATGLMEGKCTRCGETTQEVIPCQAKDEATGIGVEANEGVFAEGTTTDFVKISESDGSYESLKNALTDYGSKFSAYQIGFSQAPNGEYTLTLPNPAGLTADNVVVCLIGEDSTVTEKTFILNEDGTISVKTTETGAYAVVDKMSAGGSETDTGSQSSTASIDVPGSNEPDEKGSMLWVIIVIIAAIVVIGGAVTAVLFIKKRNNG